MSKKTYFRSQAIDDDDRVIACKVVVQIRGDGTWGAYAGSLEETDEEILVNGQPVGKQTADELFYAPSARRYLYLV